MTLFKARQKFKSINRKIISFALILPIGLTACLDTQNKTEKFAKPLPEVVDFNFDVKPILSDTCFLCHGPDKENARGGLSLDTFDNATQHVTDMGKHAIVAGKPELSEVIDRILSDDPNLIMPPPKSNLTLTSREKAIIKKWVEQGAEYKKHWAYIKPEKQRLPSVKTKKWPNNEIDYYILKPIEDSHRQPNQPADKTTLLRRVSFDLTGLPPTLAEVEAFNADTSPEAYTHLIETLIAKPAFGERMAQEWLDVARYADTHGYSTDFYRDMSPYRDWVINSFNQNRPFDEFITWQIAGDLLPNATTEQKLATAFNRIHAQNGEGGIVNEEFRVEYVKDRVQTIGTGLLGLTMHCAQCHDHKYDPISAKEYYATNAFFNSVDDSGQISYDPNDMPVPTLVLPNDDQKIQLADLTQVVKTKEQALKSLSQADNPEFKQWLRNKRARDLQATDAIVAHFPLSKNDNNSLIKNSLNTKESGKVIFGSNIKKKEGPAMQYIQIAGRDAIKLNGDDPLYFPSLNDFTRAQPFSITIDAWLPSDLKEGVLFHYNKAGILYNFKGFDVGIEDDHWHVRFAHIYPYNAISLRSVHPATREEWLNIALSYDGSSKAQGILFYINGQPVEMNIERDNLYKDIKHTRAGVLKEIGLKVGARWRSRGVANAAVDELKVYNRALTAVELSAMAQKTVSNEAQLLSFYNNRYNKTYRKKLAEQTSARKVLNALEETLPEVMIMQETATPRQAYVLLRGSYASKGAPVEPGVPETILPYDKSWPKNRIGLATWLTHDNNPLVARVIVNRYWQMFFGAGIVRTPEDFGNQGKRPTHPALLDWLAREFIDSGWDHKALIRLIVNSASYQQSSKVTAEQYAADPENILFSRGPSNRLTAEMLRDNALAASGLLITKVGGPSVHPYQPEGIWRMNNMDYVQGSGSELYRRSLYTIYKRSVPPPNMTNFDAPMRSYSIGERQNTNTPLQALTLLNDPQIVEASRVLANNVMQTRSSTEAQLVQIFKLLTSQSPNDKEQAVLKQMYNDALSAFTQTPKQADEFLNVGESPMSAIPLDEHNKITLAALGTVTNMLMNHDSAVIKR
ncbi:DUF1553 domain-containing protein [Algibacillus agarilyticus]|uniref:DUF1553 domain-containing protein n=1 Tax=Algibacillus agarilyticus TaxID=2234133 RepID=UPI000DD029B6|nr:DUF1553 domain-containing protein [Algibacillus agarilyticus]